MSAPLSSRPMITRRDWCAAAATSLATACRRRPGVGYAGFAVVATAGEKSVAVVDLSTFRLSRQIPVGEAPTAVLAHPTRHITYVLTPKSGSVHALAAGFDRAISRRVADELSAFAIAPNGERLWAAAGASGRLLEIDASTLTVTRRWKLSGAPVSLDVSAEHSIAVSTGQHGTIDLIDGLRGRQSTLNLSSPLGQVRFRPDGKLLLVANSGEQALSVVDTASGQLIVHLPLAMQPVNLCFNADGGQIFITGKGMDAVAIAFPYVPLEVEQTVLAGRDPGVMACSASPAYLFVATASGSDVCILNVANRKMIGLVEVGQKPSFIAVTPDNQYALVLNEQSGDLAVIRIASIQAKISDAAKMRNKSGGSLFTMLPVGSRPIHAAIIPRMG